MNFFSGGKTIKHETTCNPEEHGQPPTKGAIPKVSTLKKSERLFRALGDAHRLRILLLLAEKERCVAELVDILEENYSTISQRLRLLRSENLVENRREGSHVFYSLSDHHVVELLNNALQHAEELKKDEPTVS